MVARLVVVLLCLVSLSLAQKPPDGKDSSSGEILVGDWRGDSVCLVKPSGCHDEDSLYHLAKIADKPGWYSMQLDKIVNGKPVTMGTCECSYDSAKSTLACEFERGSFKFDVEGRQMQGNMTLKDGTLWRKIILKKVS